MLVSPHEHWLFVCAANLMRSPTAEFVARKRGILATSCGTSLGRFSEGPCCVSVSGAHIRWASIIVCMEPAQVECLRRRFRQMRGKRVKCWHIADDYRVYDPALIALCEARLDETLKEMGWYGEAGRPPEETD